MRVKVRYRIQGVCRYLDTGFLQNYGIGWRSQSPQHDSPRFWICWRYFDQYLPQYLCFYSIFRYQASLNVSGRGQFEEVESLSSRSRDTCCHISLFVVPAYILSVSLDIH
jgi:hypothetical protein